jgi:hypothetical protein
MGTKFNKRGLLSLVALLGLFNSPAAFAAVQVQPFLCAGADGSNASWVSIQGHNAIGITVRESGDNAGGNFSGLSGVKGNSTVSVLTIPNSTSSNLLLRLTLKTSTNQTATISATGRSGDTFEFNLAASGVKPTASITNMAVYVQNYTGSPGTIFLAHFVVNGTHVTNRVSGRGGCLNF